MDEDFAVLLEYPTRKKQPTQVSSQPLEKKKKCLHEGTDTDAGRTCLSKMRSRARSNLCADVHWLEHTMKAREYSDMDRLNAVDKTLADFLDRVDFYESLPLHDVQELLKAMKFRSGFRSINYVIAPTCILDGHKELQEKIAPFLPRSNAAWARSLAVLDPVPPVFVRSWLKNLLKSHTNTEETSPQFTATFYRHRTSSHVRTDQVLWLSYEQTFRYEQTPLANLYALPLELRHVVKYTFSPAELSSERGEKEVLADSNQPTAPPSTKSHVSYCAARARRREKMAAEGTSSTTG